MAEKNPFMQFPGHLEFVAGELTRDLAEAGGHIVEVIGRLAQPANKWALDDVKATFRKLLNIFRVKIGGRRTIAEVVGVSGYTWYNPTVLERYALSGGRERWVTIEVFDIEHFDHDPSDAEIEAEYVRRGLGRPDVDHAIHFGDQYRHLPMEDHPVVFYLKNPIPGAYGGRGVLGVWRGGARRELRWDWLSPGSRWGRRYLFAGVRE